MVQAVSGLMSTIGGKGAPPAKVQVPAVDMTTGFLATTAVLAALRERDRTGRGQHLDVNMYNSALMLQQSGIASYLSSGEKPARIGSAAPYSAPNEAYRTRDGWIMIAAYHEDRWKALCHVLGDPGLASHPDFATNPARVAKRAELAETIERHLAAKTTAEWQAAMEACDIICGPIADYDEVMASPQLEHNGVIVEMEHPAAGTIKMPGMTLGDRGAQSRVRRAPPMLGAHSREVLEQFGFGANQIEDLLNTGTVIQG
jgi:crotonobetainyl-CoA:carnitine CoA-transferase CaiB-like acyl-CoA transferase